MCANEISPEPASPPKRRRTWWWKIPLVLLFVLILLVVILLFSLSTLATRIANQKLPDLLDAEASVGRIMVYPARGMVSIQELHIGQPSGFGDAPLVDLKRVMAQVDLKSLTSGEGIIIRAVEVEGLTANVVKNAEGIFNLLRLVPPATEAGAVPSADAPDPAPEPVEPTAAESAKPGIRIERVEVSGVAVTYTDHTPGSRPVEISLGNLGIELADGLVELTGTPKVTLGQGSVTLEDLHIAQPDAFGEDALLDLPRVHLTIGTEPFVENIVRLQALELSGLRAHIIRNEHGVMNVARLGGGPPPPPPTPEEEMREKPDEAAAADVAAADPAEPTPSEPAAPPVGVYLGELKLTDFQITYADATLVEGEPMEFICQDIRLELRELMAFLPEPPTPNSALDFSLSLDQGEHPPALIALLAAVGPIQGGVPDVNAQFKLTGLMMDTLGALVPASVENALGASAADLQLSVALNESSIDLDGVLATDGGHEYDLVVHGPLTQPTVDLGPLMFAVAGRMVGGVANIATGSMGAALDVTEGVAGGAKELGKGATGVIGGIGGGLFKAAKGALSGDLKGLEEGVKGATVGAVSDASESVIGAGGTVLSEAKEGAQSATGSKRRSAWAEAGSSRHEADLAAARSALEEMPFPPPDVSGSKAQPAE